MYIIALNDTNHDFEKKNLVTIRGKRGGYDNMICKNCGMKGKRYSLATIEIGKNYSEKNVFDCKNAPKIETTKRIKITNKPNVMNNAFDNCIIGSEHNVIPTPKGEKIDNRGVWIQGVGEPIKLLTNEFEYI